MASFCAFIVLAIRWSSGWSVFFTETVNLGSIPGRVKPKTITWYSNQAEQCEHKKLRCESTVCGRRLAYLHIDKATWKLTVITILLNFKSLSPQPSCKREPGI